ncbi:hypothetical protein [Polynucleobacter sp. es-MAR-4]|uniref:hypothetical protein n=1 Tax=Polynucleobacter sp. es-MAR-4 TaxID=1855655 RepID=UPI001C0CE5A8|nr:hypothetical protein [Polynucleobacter sp. es-MAR-4]MBU3636703.1 hypothetical protein [Polynucleobacter sp. es-MAR-4]
MKPIKTLILTNLFVGFATGTHAQELNAEKFAKSYKESCTKQQAQIHAKMKDISAESFNEYCDCTARKLITNISSDQVKELNQSGGNPAWLKAAEQQASKACIKEGPAIRT